MSQHDSVITRYIADDIENSNKKSQTNSPAFDSFHNGKVCDAVKPLNSLTPVEVTQTWMAVSAIVLASCNTERRRRSSANGKYVLSVVLTILEYD